MKVFNTIMKILAALAVVAGIVFVIIKYGERIVAWTRQLVNRCCEFFGCDCSCCCDCDCEDCDCECDCDDCDCDCECDCGCAVEEIAEETVVAEESDFEG